MKRADLASMFVVAFSRENNNTSRELLRVRQNRNQKADFALKTKVRRQFPGVQKIEVREAKLCLDDLARILSEHEVATDDGLKNLQSP